MHLILYHHQAFRFNLQELFAGQTRYAASVARLRLLFWIAARGHTVTLVGNVEQGELKGVRALDGEASLEIALGQSAAGETIILLNDPPPENDWERIRNLKKKGIQIILWINNGADATWRRRAVTGDVERIVCISNWMREVYRIYSGFDKIEVSYLGVDSDLIENELIPKSRQPVVLSISVPRRSKGFHHLLRAWSTIRRRRPDAQLKVCGSARMHDPQARVGKTGVLDADVEAEFPEFFSEAKTAERTGIELLGACTLGEVYRNLKSAAVAVVNCNWRGSLETYCRAAVEAQMAGTPVVGAARGSLPEVVANERTGLLVHREDPEALADSILRLLNDNDLRSRLSTAGPQWARPFADYSLLAKDWEAIAERGWRGEPAPAVRKPVDDLLRAVGYGSVRTWVRQLVKA